MVPVVTISPRQAAAPAAARPAARARWASASAGLPSTFAPTPRSITASPRDSVTSNAGSAAAKAARLASVTATGAPTTSAPCSPNAAAQSARGEFPVREMALHDLEARRDPFDRRQASPAGSSVSGTGAFSLNTTSGSIRGCTNAFSGSDACAVRREMHGVRPDMRPHRLIDAVARPDRAVGEADLAADRPPALRAPARLDVVQHRVAVGDAENPARPP